MHKILESEGKISYFCIPAEGENSYFFMVAVAQLVRASDCGSEGRGFEPH